MAKQKMTNAEFMNFAKPLGSKTFQADIPDYSVSKDDNGAEWDNGAPVLDYSANVNEFLDIVNKIAKQVFIQRFYTNPLSDFVKDLPATGDTIEELHQNLYIIKTFGGMGADGADEFKRTKPDIEAAYHTQDVEWTCPATIQEREMKKAFLEPYGLQKFVDKIIGMMYSSAENQLYGKIKAVIKTAHDATGTGNVMHKLVLGTQPTTEQGWRDVATKIAKQAYDYLEYTKTFNMSGRDVFSDHTDLVLFVDSTMAANLDMNVFATLFNVGYSDQVRSIKRYVIPSGFGVPDMCGLLMDRNFLQIYLTEYRMKKTEVGSNEYINFWLHRNGVVSYSKFVNVSALKWGTA